MTFKEKVEELLEEAEAASLRAGRGEAGREFALSKTKLEEALVRYTRGRAFEEGSARFYRFYDFDA